MNQRQTTRVAGIYTYMQMFYLQILIPGIMYSNQTRMVWYDLSLFSLFFVLFAFLEVPEILGGVRDGHSHLDIC